MPLLSTDYDETASRLRALARCDICERCELPDSQAITDIARLLNQVSRLYAALRNERLRSANLEAAIRAALGAESDGEADPLGYFRDDIAGSIGGAYGA